MLMMNTFPSFLRRMTFASFLIVTAFLFSWNTKSANNNGGMQLFANAETTGVIKLTAKNFDKKLSDGNVWLIEFYAPW
jgi:hypothetical protein